jgi:drug/metabolite transporter (DMT)-like permease
MFIGELISLGVALSWTATALFAEVGSKRMGSLPFNTIRMTMSLLLLNKDGLAQLHHAVNDRKAMWCVLASTVFGPFIGVSASLLATQYTSAGIAQMLFALTPILIIAPAALLFHQKVTLREVLGAIISVVGVCLFFV